MDTQQPRQKARSDVLACNPSIGEAETGESLGSTGQLSLAGKFHASEIRCLKNKLDSST